ncbi:Pancreatic triacylglycerol lipase [Nymphon striatum]|nr:Pancreatic triacylglycerol lipase [Nymphon striatum]
MCPTCTNVWVRDLGNYRYPVEKIGESPAQYGKKDPSPDICYRRVGCFSTSGVYYNLMRRPINLLPEDPVFMNIEFSLFTRAQGKDVLFLDEEDVLASSSFNSSNGVKFIIHGYMDNGQYEWVTKMTEELLVKSNFNVIVVDWSKAAMPPYAQAVANTRVVGVMLAEFIKFLGNNTGIRPEDCHLIGHSLGAHAAGYCGQRLNKLGRITGLDPAFPYFSDMSSEVVLDTSDADFVDVIHTDGRSAIMTGMGMNARVGHMDFYPNGGRDQPGCTASNRIGSFFTNGVFGGVRKLFACNHMRAMDYFTESINTDCPFTGFQCENWKKFEDGQCINCGSDGHRCAPLGFHSIDYRQKSKNEHGANYYLKTNEESPFCYYNYWLKINLEHKLQVTDVTGIIFLTIHGTKGDLRNAKLYDGWPFEFELLKFGCFRRHRGPISMSSYYNTTALRELHVVVLPS